MMHLATAGFERVSPKLTGRPDIYGYLSRIRSSRRLETETHRNLEVIWLLRRMRVDL